MPIDVDYIQKLKTYLVDDYHGARVRQQEKDQTYADGTFSVQVIGDTSALYRPSTGARLINRPASHIITSNPQFFRYPRTLGEVESAGRVSSLGNNWLKRLMRQNPQPISQSVKTNIKRGEAWIYVIFNEDWKTNKQFGMPVYFRVPDPLTIFASPNQSEIDGVPEELIVFYERSVYDIQREWPIWKPSSADAKTVWWLEYWSASYRYFEADKIPVIKGIEKNILGFVPYVHCYSGFGGDSDKPEDLAIGRLRYCQDLLEEECATKSDVRTAIHRHVYPPVDFRVTDANVTISKKLIQQYDMGAYQANIIPFGVTREKGLDFMPPAEAFQHLYNIQADLNREMSPIFEGGLVGSSGRHTDLTRVNALRMYDSIVEGIEASWSTAFGLALRILDKIPNMMPVTVSATTIKDDVPIRKDEKVSKSDIGGYYDCEIKLKAADAIEADRLATLYAKGFLDKLIDAETCLVEGWGKTQSEAKKIIKNVMIDQVTLHSPMFTQIMGFQMAKEAGYLEQFMEAMQQGNVPMGLGAPQPRKSEIETPGGAEMTDMALTERGVRERQTLGGL